MLDDIGLDRQPNSQLTPTKQTVSRAAHNGSYKVRLLTLETVFLWMPNILAIAFTLSRRRARWQGEARTFRRLCP